MRFMHVTQENRAEPPMGCVPKGGIFLVRVDLGWGYGLRQSASFWPNRRFGIFFPAKRAGTSVGECKHKENCALQLFARVSTAQRFSGQDARGLVVRLWLDLRHNVRCTMSAYLGQVFTKLPKLRIMLFFWPLSPEMTLAMC